MTDVNWDDINRQAEIGQAQADKEDIKHALKHDSEFFIDFYLHEELVWDIPALHINMFDRLKNTTAMRLVLAIPRGHAKTTLSKLVVLWYLLFTPYRFCVYLSSTLAIGKNACRDIINFLKSYNHIQVFGEIKIEKENESEGLWIFKIGDKRCILRAYGAGQQMRGINVDNKRPEIVVADDLEDPEDIKNETQQKKIIEWFFGTFIKALARDYKLIHLGNMISSKCLLKIHCDSPRWQSVILGALIRDSHGNPVPLWPDLWTLEALQEDFQEYQRNGLMHIWMAEMMNKPGTGAAGFDARQFFYQNKPNPGDQMAAFITIDPAFGKETIHDNTAIVCHAIFEDRPPMVVDHRVGKFSEAQVFDRALEMAYTWDAWVWGSETGGAQKVLITLFEYLKVERQLVNLQLVPIPTGNVGKGKRIGGWVGAMEHKSYALPVGDIAITSQLLDYDRSTDNNDDDLIDACASGMHMLENYLPLIRSTFLAENFAQAQGTMEICNA